VRNPFLKKGGNIKANIVADNVGEPGYGNRESLSMGGRGPLLREGAWYLCLELICSDNSEANFF